MGTFTNDSMNEMMERYLIDYEHHVQSAIERYFRVTDVNSCDRFDCSYREFAEQIVQFSLDINRKANELLSEGSVHEEINPSELQKKLFEIGKNYIKTFTSRHQQKIAGQNRLQSH